MPLSLSDIRHESLLHPHGGVLEALLEQRGLKESPREFDGLEYEIKFTISGLCDTLDDYLQTIEGDEVDSKSFIVDRVRRVSHLQSHFFADGLQEYSLFTWNGGPMLKIKKHTILRGLSLPIFKSAEGFQVEPEAIRRTLSEESLQYAGTMRKDRIKDFIIDDDGRIYSIAVTICETAAHYQRQFEVEYSGYLDGFPVEGLEEEPIVLQRLIALSQRLAQRSCIPLLADEERKFEFVQRFSAINERSAAAIKQHISEELAEESR